MSHNPIQKLAALYKEAKLPAYLRKLEAEGKAMPAGYAEKKMEGHRKGRKASRAYSRMLKSDSFGGVFRNFDEALKAEQAGKKSAMMARVYSGSPTFAKTPEEVAKAAKKARHEKLVAKRGKGYANKVVARRALRKAGLGTGSVGRKLAIGGAAVGGAALGGLALKKHLAAKAAAKTRSQLLRMGALGAGAAGIAGLATAAARSRRKA